MLYVIEKWKKHEDTVIYKFSGVACFARATMSIRGLVCYTGWWDASLWLHSAIVHIMRAGGPEIVRCIGFLHTHPLFWKPFWFHLTD